MKKIPIKYGNYYHIFNKGNNSDNLFFKTEHYKHFLNLYEIYIEPIAETFAWCLMKNHFHTFVRIKDEDEIGFLNSKNSKREDSAIKWKIYFPEKIDKNFNRKPVPINMFQHLFNAYARWFNLKTNRTDKLFKKDFERRHVENKNYFENLIIYINNNPVHHGFVEHPIEYSWSSYNTVISTKTTKLKRAEVLNYFDDIENFKFIHAQKQDYEIIKNYIIE